MLRQRPLTLITPVAEEQYNELTYRLQKVRTDIEAGVHQPFENLGTIHYARWVLLKKDTDEKTGKVIPPRLVFSSDYDGEEETHLTGLATEAGCFIDLLYECCAGYPSPDARTPESRKNYLKQHRIKATAFFAGAPGRSLKQIGQENELRNYIWNFLKDNQWDNQSAVDIHRAIQQNVYAQPEYQWAKEPIKLPAIKWLRIGIVALILILLAVYLVAVRMLLLIFLVMLIVWIIIVHFFYEKKDKPLGLTRSQLDEAHVEELEEYEDLHNQNQFTQLLTMKPGKVRIITLLAFMQLAKLLIQYLFVEGKLMGIPTIHFARWVMFDDNKRMIFFSNFDGSWQQYLGDFIDKSGWGLTGIWSNTINFPKTRFLFWGGAYDEEHFLAWSRYYQIPTQIWYCAYPHLSIKNINNNSFIRHELQQNLNEEQAQKFLQRF